MRILLFLICFSFSINAHADNITITSLADWNNYMTMVSNTIPADDIVTIVSGSAIIMNHGTINSFGTINIVFPGIFENFGTINNAGTINNSYIFINAAGSVINNSFGGKITGSIDNSGTINSCSTITVVATSNPINLNMIPLGTICDDGDPNTINDEITIADNCASCAGTLPPPPAAPIPTLSEWGLILLSMSLSILGIVGLKQRVLV